MRLRLTRAVVGLVLLAGIAAAAPRVPTQAKTDPGEQIVYVTKTGSKYHRASCSSLRKSAIPMKLKDAAARYSPCKICKPPVLDQK